MVKFLQTLQISLVTGLCKPMLDYFSACSSWFSLVQRYYVIKCRSLERLRTLFDVVKVTFCLSATYDIVHCKIYCIFVFANDDIGNAIRFWKVLNALRLFALSCLWSLHWYSTKWNENRWLLGSGIIGREGCTIWCCLLIHLRQIPEYLIVSAALLMTLSWLNQFSWSMDSNFSRNDHIV